MHGNDINHITFWEEDMLSPFMVSSATPMTAEIVCAPASNPAASPALYPIKIANNQVIIKQPTHMSAANPT